MDNDYIPMPQPSEEWKQLELFKERMFMGIDLSNKPDCAVLQTYERMPHGGLKLVHTEILEHPRGSL